MLARQLTTSGVPHARIAREILLERVDDARRRQSKEVLRRYARLELRDDADAGRRHLLGRQNNRRAGWRNVRYQRAGFCRHARRLDALYSFDVDACVKKAVAAGAKLMKPVFDVPNVGRIAILQEPGGAGIGWMTPTD